MVCGNSHHHSANEEAASDRLLGAEAHTAAPGWDPMKNPFLRPQGLVRGFTALRQPVPAGCTP